MKVKELIERLQKIDPELDLTLSRDEEGNGYLLADDYVGVRMLLGGSYFEEDGTEWLRTE